MDASAVYTGVWVDKHTPWGVVSAVLRFTDTAEDALYDAIAERVRGSHPVAAAAWREMFEWNVRRALSGRFFTDKLCDRARVGVRLLAVGRKSYTMRFDVTADDATRAPMAVVDVVAVHVDAETQSRALPVPHAELLKTFIEGARAGEVEVTLPAGPSEAERRRTGTFETVVRKTDCDRNGHVTNSNYPLLAMEALPLPHCPPMGLVHVEYVAPIRPGHPLAVSCVTCEREDADAYWCELHAGGAAAARVLLRPLEAGYRTAHLVGSKL